jgi:hypothetical protein
LPIGKVTVCKTAFTLYYIKKTKFIQRKTEVNYKNPQTQTLGFFVFLQFNTFYMQENKSNILIYQTEDGVTKIETHLLDETVWLTQAQICELFQKSKSTVSEHLKNIFEEGELNHFSTVRKFRTVQ